MANEYSWHDQFAAGGLTEGVVTIQSCDNVKFNIHRKNLETSTGAFPAAEFETNNEVVYLTETGDVLAILFRFIYPQRHPSLEDLEFNVLIQVAEAAEKYEVFAAMNIASIRLSETLPKHALDIFAHGIKHNYPKLINKAAVCVARYSWAAMTERLPVVAVRPWAQYQESWAAVFDAGIAVISGLQQDRQTCRHRAPVQLGFGGTINPPGEFICHGCFFMLKAWIMSLERVTGSAADLSRAIANPGDMGRPFCGNTARPLARSGSNMWSAATTSQLHGRTSRGYDLDGSCQTCPDHETACIHLAEVQSTLKDAVAKVPPFSSFL